MEIEGEMSKSCKILEIGLSPIKFQQLQINEKNYLLCLCDRPTLLSFDNYKIKLLILNITLVPLPFQLNFKIFQMD